MSKTPIDTAKGVSLQEFKKQFLNGHLGALPYMLEPIWLQCRETHTEYT